MARTPGRWPDDVPIKLGRVSNGEYLPSPPTPVAREATRRTLAEAEVLELAATF